MRRLLLILCSLSLLALGACQKKNKTKTAPVGKPTTPATQPNTNTGNNNTGNQQGNNGGATTDPAGPEKPISFGPIYYDYDDSTLTTEAQDALLQIAAYLEDHPSATLLVTGHADERGTPEYNLALGDERAQTVRDFLSYYGISPERVQTLSYGEELPAIEGSDEASWALNRRSEFVLSSQDATASAGKKSIKTAKFPLKLNPAIVKSLKKS